MLEQLQGLYALMTFKDIIDIVVVAFFLYKVYIMMKGTRASTLIKGLAVLVLFSICCRWANLHVMSWLLDKGMTMILVALPVLFQPELRRALDQIGRGSIWGKHSGLNDAELTKLVDEVGDAVKVMSRDKVGALMVFERATGLAERIETGIMIDGLVSNGLIQNIFVKDTPLHDGGVIIRGNRIVATNCILPLTDNRNLSQELGTRHRCAIGMSEQSDAIIVVVSEETGTISIARNGELFRYLSVADMKNMLLDSLAKTDSKVKEGIQGKANALWGKRK